MSNPKVSLAKLHQYHAQVIRAGCSYGLGAKAPLHAVAGSFHRIDCSGYARVLLFNATNGELSLPDGSQNQRAWAEKNLREVKYTDAAKHMTGKRLFVAFIKPFQNGCGSVGHIWLLADGDPGVGVEPETIESHGGVGPNSRRWNTGVLVREVFSCFELETVEGAK